MIRYIAILAVLGLTACQTSPRNTPRNMAPTGQGQYVRPAYLNPQPIPRIPPTDVCQSQLYQGLVGQPEGAIYIPGLPGRKRVIKPAFDEGFGVDDEFENVDDPLRLGPTMMQIRDYLPGQALYAPSIRTPGSLLAAADFDRSRLTIELDDTGYVQEVRCG